MECLIFDRTGSNEKVVPFKGGPKGEPAFSKPFWLTELIHLVLNRDFWKYWLNRSCPRFFHLGEHLDRYNFCFGREKIVNKNLFIPIWNDRNFLVNLLSYGTVYFGKPKIFEYVLLFTSMPFNHFFCFTIECRRLTGHNSFDFTLRCSSIGFEKHSSQANIIRYKTIEPMTTWSCAFSCACHHFLLH